MKFVTLFTVLVPFVAKNATKWHPTTTVGPFATLTRGAFKTEAEAHTWARENLGGHPYEVTTFEGVEGTWV